MRVRPARIARTRVAKKVAPALRLARRRTAIARPESMHEHRAASMGTGANVLADRIQRSADDAMAKLREKSDAHLGEYFEHLAAAEKDVRQAIAEFTLDPQSESPAKLARLESLKSEIDRIVDDMNARHAGLAERQTDEGFDDGIGSGVGSMRARPAPRGWGGLTDAQLAAAAARATALIDRSGLEFLSAYRLELAGNVADELKSKIKSAVAGGIVRGDSISTVVQNLGRVITDPEKFRRAGQETPRGFVGRVFPSAANRLAAIVETENNRAHNQGRVAFYSDVGIGRVRWLTSGLYDCPVCSPRNGKVYKLDELPTIPAHTHCDCVVVGEPDPDDVDEMKTPEDYGVVFDTEDFPEDEPERIAGEEHRWPGMPPGTTYRSNAASTADQRFVAEYADAIAQNALDKKARPPTLADGYELRVDRAGITGGYYNPAEQRIGIFLKKPDGRWRSFDEVTWTYLEELGHAKSYLKGWVSRSRVTNRAPNGLKREVNEFLLNLPDSNELPEFFDVWNRVTKYPPEKHDEEAIAKMFARMKIDPDSFKTHYPKFFRLLKSL